MRIESIEELWDRREGKGRLWFFGYLMQLEGEGGVIVRQSFKKRLMEIWWDLNLGLSDNWLCTLPLDHQDMWRKKNLTDICWISIQLRTTLQQQLKLNGESAKSIMTTFAFLYVSYLLYGLAPVIIWTQFLFLFKEHWLFKLPNPIFKVNTSLECFDRQSVGQFHQTVILIIFTLKPVFKD